MQLLDPPFELMSPLDTRFNWKKKWTKDPFSLFFHSWQNFIVGGKVDYNTQLDSAGISPEFEEYDVALGYYTSDNYLLVQSWVFIDFAKFGCNLCNKDLKFPPFKWEEVWTSHCQLPSSFGWRYWSSWTFHIQHKLRSAIICWWWNETVGRWH